MQAPAQRGVRTLSLCLLLLLATAAAFPSVELSRFDGAFLFALNATALEANVVARLGATPPCVEVLAGPDPMLPHPNETFMSWRFRGVSASPLAVAFRTMSAAELLSGYGVENVTASYVRPPSNTSTASRTVSSSASVSAPATATHTTVASASSTAVASATASSNATASATTAATASSTVNPTGTLTAAATATLTATVSPTATVAPTVSASASGSSSRSPELIATRTATATASVSPSPTLAVSPTATAAATGTGTMTGTSSLAVSGSATVAVTPTGTLPMTVTASASPSESRALPATASVSTTGSGTLSLTLPASPSKTHPLSTTLSTTLSVSATSSLVASASPTTTSSRSLALPKTDSVTLTASSTPAITATATGTMTLELSTTASLPRSGTVSLAATPSATTSLPVSRTVSASSTASLPLPATATANTTATGTLTLALTQTGSGSATTSLELPRTVSPSRATHTASLTVSQSLALSVSQTVVSTPTASLAATASNATTVTLTPTGTHAFTESATVRETTSVPLPWLEGGLALWIARPVPHAAPSVLLPVQPVVLLVGNVSLAAAVATVTYDKADPYNAGGALVCYARLGAGSDAGVSITGAAVVPMVQSLCAFTDLALAVEHTAGGLELSPSRRVVLEVCANTTTLWDPAIPQHPCNTTAITVAACPAAKSGTMHNITAAVSDDLLAGGPVVSTVVGYAFPYEDRENVTCTYHAHAAADPAAPVATTPAMWLDYCRVECTFTPAMAQAAGLNTTGMAFDGVLRVAVAGRESTATCPASAAFDPASELSRSLQSPCSDALTRPPDCNVTTAPVAGCRLRFVGASARVVYSPRSGTQRVTGIATRQTLPEVTSFFCDAVGSPVTSNSSGPFGVGLRLGTVGAVLVGPRNESVTYRDVSFFVPAADRFVDAAGAPIVVCPRDDFPLLFAPPEAYGWAHGAEGRYVLSPTTDPFCTGVDVGRPAFLAISNAAAVLPDADTLAPMPVPVMVTADDTFRQTITTLGSPVRLNCSVVSVATGAVVATYPLEVSAFPAACTGVVFPEVGPGFTVRVSLADDARVNTTLSTAVTVSYCAPELRDYRGILRVEATFGREVCGRPAELHLQDTVFVNATAPTRLTIHGAMFDYANRAHLRCHYAQVGDYWGPMVAGVAATWVSSCRMLCDVPPVLFPIRAASGRVVNDTSGATYPAAALPGAVGELRVRTVVGGLWSSPTSVDAIGDGVALRITEWAQNLYPRFVKTQLMPIELTVHDAVGNSLRGADPAVRTVRLTSPSRAAQLINGSVGVDVTADTCGPTAGVAHFTDLFLSSPQQGDYSLDFAAAGLSELRTLLHIEIVNLAFRHVLSLLPPMPLDFTAITLDASTSGRLPVQPTVGIFRRVGDSVSTVVDTNISDIQCLATVLPDDPAERYSDPQAVGLNLTTCAPEFGNCQLFLKGQVQFTTLRFVGIPGHNYTVHLRMSNASLEVSTVSFAVRVPVCDTALFTKGSATSVIAHVEGLSNTSLQFPGDGVLLKGWQFPTPAAVHSANHGYYCLFAGSVFPATFEDLCTVRCMVRPAAAVPALTTVCGTTPAENATCCYDTPRSRVVCNQPVNATLTLALGVNTTAVEGNTLSSLALPGTALATLPAASQHVTVGDYSVVGVPAGIVVAPNEQAPRRIFGNEQVVLSAANVTLDAFIIHFHDALGQFVTYTDTARRPVRVSLWRRAAVARLGFPATAETVQQTVGGAFVGSDDPATCFPNATHPAQWNTTTCGVAAEGTVSFDLWLERPMAGTYDAVVEAFDPAAACGTTDGLTAAFTTTLTVHVLPGMPERSCLFTAYDGVRVRTGQDLVRQPRLLLLDAGGNLFQSVRLQATLAAIKTLVIDPAVSALEFNVTVASQNFDLRNGTGVGPFAMDPGAITGDWAVDYIELKHGIGTFQFRSVQLTPVFGRAYRLVFEGLTPPPTSPSVFLSDCAPTEYGVNATSTCEACPQGLANCNGGPTVNCFTCNGSTWLNVTQGYWRYAPGSTQAYYCSTGGECLGDTELGSCGDGYKQHSPLCAVCDPGFARDVLGSCLECDSTWLNVLIVLFFLVAAAVVVTVLVIVTLREDGNEEGDHSLVLLLKIFLNFVQVVGMLGEFQVNFPAYVMAYFNYVAVSSGGAGISISPVNCLLPDFTFFHKLLVQLMAPIVILPVVALFILGHGIRRRRKYVKLQEQGSDRAATGNVDSAGLPRYFNRRLFITASIVILFLMYQTIITQCIEALRCIDLSSGIPGSPDGRVLRADSRIACKGSSYEQFVSFGLYGLFLYGVVLPLGGMVVVLRVARSQGWFVANGTFSFLIRGFRLRFWFWEFVIVLRKVIVRIVLSTITEATLQALTGIWSLTALFVIHAFTRPYVKQVHNIAEALSLLACVTTLNVGLLFRVTQQASGDVCGAVCNVVTVVLIAANIGVMLFFLYHICRSGYDRLVEMFGVDQADGTRVISIRNVWRLVFTVLGREERLAPSFRTYTPRFQDRELARTVLEDDFDESDEGSDFEDVDGSSSESSDTSSTGSEEEMRRMGSDTSGSGEEEVMPWDGPSLQAFLGGPDRGGTYEPPPLMHQDATS